MLITRDIWVGLPPEKKLKEMEEALTQLKEIDTPRSKLKTKLDQGRLTNVKKDLEQFIIDAVTWESDRQLQRY